MKKTSGLSGLISYKSSLIFSLVIASCGKEKVVFKENSIFIGNDRVEVQFNCKPEIIELKHVYTEWKDAQTYGCVDQLKGLVVQVKKKDGFFGQYLTTLIFISITVM